MCLGSQLVFGGSDRLRRVVRAPGADDHQLRGQSRNDHGWGKRNVDGVFANGTGVITPGNLAAVSGTAVTVSPTVTTTYTLTVTPTSGAAVTQTATITVNPAPTITSFSASPATITAGASTA